MRQTIHRMACHDSEVASGCYDGSAFTKLTQKPWVDFSLGSEVSELCLWLRYVL